MAAEEKPEAGAAPATTSASPAAAGGGKLVTILTIVNLVITLGVAGVLFMSFKNDKKKAAVEDIAAHDEGHGGKEEKGGHGGGDKGKDTAKKLTQFGKMVTLEQFTVNLSTPGSVSPKFVRVNISVEVPNEDTEAELTQKMPQVRNAIIDLFNSKRPGDLANAEGRDYLKEEIRNALNSFMVTGKVKGVFFTNFALTS